MTRVIIAVALVCACGMVGTAHGQAGSSAGSGQEGASRLDNEAAAIRALRAMVSAQATYSSVCGGGFYSPGLTNLAAPGTGAAAGFGPFVLADMGAADRVTRYGYVITIGSSAGPAANAPPSCNGLPAGRMTPGYYATATPDSAETGSRAFAVNTAGTIWFAVQTTPIRLTDNAPPAKATRLK